MFKLNCFGCRKRERGWVKGKSGISVEVKGGGSVYYLRKGEIFLEVFLVVEFDYFWVVGY